MSDDKRDEGSGSKSPESGEKTSPSWVDQDPFATDGASTTTSDKIRLDPNLDTPEKPTSAPVAAPTPSAEKPSTPTAAKPPASTTASATSTKASTPKTEATSPAAGGETEASPRGAAKDPAGARRRITEETPRAKPGRKLLGLPYWGWPLLLILAIAVLLIVFDARNRGRYRLLCQDDHLEVQRGRRLMWPFGYEPMGGLYRRIVVPADADCQTQVFRSRAEVESAFLDFILTQARRSLGSSGSTKLKKVREQVLQAMRITREDPHRSRRAEAERLLADVAYRQGRAGLTRVENELRTAIGHLQEAQKRAGDRYDDLDDWIEHLESLLKTVAPAPGGSPGMKKSPSTFPSVPRPRIGSSPRPPRPSDLAPPPPTPKSPAPVESPDAGPPSSGGILM